MSLHYSTKEGDIVTEETYENYAVSFFLDSVQKELTGEENSKCRDDAIAEFTRCYRSGLKRWNDKKTLTDPEGASTSEMLRTATFILGSAKENKRRYKLNLCKYSEYAGNVGHALGVFFGFFLYNSLDNEKFNKLREEEYVPSEREQIHAFYVPKKGMTLFIPLIADFAAKLKELVYLENVRVEKQVEIRYIGRAIRMMLGKFRKKLDKDHQEFLEICAAFFNHQ